MSGLSLNSRIGEATHLWLTGTASSLAKKYLSSLANKAAPFPLTPHARLNLFNMCSYSYIATTLLRQLHGMLLMDAR